MAQAAKSTRVERLLRLAGYLERGAEQWRSAMADPAVARALHVRFGPAVSEIEATRQLVAEVMAAPAAGRRTPPRDLLERLHDGLANLALLAAHQPVAPRPGHDPLPQTVIDFESRTRAIKIETSTRSLLKKLRNALLGLGFAAGIAMAMPAAAGTGVGDTIINPSTGASGVIVKSESNYVTTNTFWLVFPGLTGLTATDATNQTAITDPTTTDAAHNQVKVIGVTINPTTHLATSIRVEESDGTQRDIATFVDKSATVDPLDEAGDGPTTVTQTLASGDNKVIQDVRVSANGSNGRNGGGFNIFGFVIGVSAGNGGAGADGVAITRNIPSSAGLIEAVSPNLSGIEVGSVGGGGGRGGNAAFSFGVNGGTGGKAGVGGAVTVTNDANITTSGAAGHGMHIFSRSGAGGVAGTVQFGVAQGGAGGAGNGGGTAIGTNYATIDTTGKDAIGLFVQSLGGQSGNGGSSYGIVGIAGSALQAGAGGTAKAYNYGAVTTSGLGAHGVVAQSIGGTGGKAGDSIGIVALLGNNGNGTGGAGGYAFAYNGAGGVITTTGNDSYGLMAQSVGGGGGDGGYAAGLVGLGAKGGAAGDGGAAEASLAGNGRIQTTGAGSYGIFAQSIGGGGGNGGVGGGLVALGGDGASGGDGGAVTVTTDQASTIATSGESAHAIFAESVGKGGGTGGTGGGVVTIGGGGSGGGAAGIVTVTNNGDLTTTGKAARGIFAQSVGGGGGSANGSGGLVSLGGSAGGAGAGGAVTVTNNGTIRTGSNVNTGLTDKVGSDGIFAQSIGGGGGSGGASGGLVSLGGGGGGGGAGGTVTVENSGIISTEGARARGIFAQSVGGGGGSGGDSGGLVSIGGKGGSSTLSIGGAVTVTNTGTVITHGPVSSAIHAQSIGGGGGDGGTSGSGLLSIGGSGAGGGNGGKVVVKDSNDLETQGNDSHGIFAQSVGGGGGSGGSATSVSAFIGASVGGKGALGGEGGEVIVDFDDRTVNLGVGGTTQLSPLILTKGQRSMGIFAQSVGGGGGNGGFAAQASAGYGFAGSVAVGGAGGAGGKGGLVTLTGDAVVRTEGDFSPAIFAQSVGGGGGNGGFAVAIAASGSVNTGSGSISVGVGGSGGSGGIGDKVTLNMGGGVYTVGAFSTGLLAQSVGGGGGNGGFSLSVAAAAATAGTMAIGVGVGGSGGTGGKGGIVDVHYAGDITTAGYSSTGAIVQSIGGGGGNGGFNISAAVAVGTQGLPVGVGVGGSGGSAGNGDLAKGIFDGDIETGLLATATAPDGTPQGDLKAALDQLKSVESAGLVVQSVGGGGGNGGFNISGSIAVTAQGGLPISVGVGGSGGGAGNGGLVIAEAHNITTHADHSAGFLAQSVGGGGGNGGLNISGSIGISGSTSPTISVGVGGAGGVGGFGQKATGKITGTVITEGHDSDAITVQSLGGGGGNGGVSVAAGVALSQTVSGNIGVSVGGAGGGGQSGGAVELKVNENVANPDHDLVAAYTQGDGSSGVIAQSLGGGGGNGGISVAGGLAISAEGNGNIMVGVGGAGGGAGSASTVLGVVEGNVVTRGDDATGVLMQSLGGSGGNGGFNVSGGIAASGNGGRNILVGVGVGGVGGGAGNGSVVTGTVTGDVETGWGEYVNSAFTRHGDDAGAVTFQSLGGGGGNGGFNVTGGIAVGLGDSATGNLGVGVGGFAGGGGYGTSVVGNVTGNVRTYGDRSYGILVQSAGGGGGNGGFNITGNFSASAGLTGNIGVGIGGFGGDGGSSIVAPLNNQTFVVTSILKGDVITYGKDAFGVTLQSLGGGGGNGGFNVTGNIAFSTGASGAGNIGVGIGGFGGTGGSAGGVFGDITGTYQTNGENATAITAQSVGGGGGNGALNVTGNMSFATGAGATAGSFSFGLGGFGGTGGSAGKVSLTRVGDTETFGSGSDGIFAQSLGGGGGRGAINVSGDIDLSKGAAGSLSVGIGGFGGTGGSAETVGVRVTGDVWAHNNGNGVFVQSAGGGGGAGGFNITGQLNLGKTTGRGLAFGLGGFGGAAGDGKAATLVLSGPASNMMAQVVGNGDKRSAIQVQSVGGGGGDGAFNITGGIAGDGELAIGLGGFGADAGKGALADAHVEANLFASGHQARGMMVQSVGGGGGSGGFNISAAGNKSTEISMAFGLGGFGGNGNSSGVVNAWHKGQISVDGINAIGLFAQSVAGGGGDGGLNVAVEVNLQTKGKGLSVGVGGTAGTGADAEKVTVTNVGSIFVNANTNTSAVDATLYDQMDEDVAIRLSEHSHALVAQSVGGGGGVGGINVVSAITPDQGKPLALGVGGSGGSGGNGGVVEVSQGWDFPGGTRTEAPGVLRTYGDGSIALLAQSVGGGGGDAGMNLTVPITYKSKPGDPPLAGLISVGGSGAGAGYGDTVTVVHRGDIVTGYADGANGPVGNGGDGSGGILAQSVGGGGGNANLNLGLGVTRNATVLGIAVGGATGAAGKGGVVNVTHNGGIFTYGDDSTAITAQSIGGGGGNVATSLALPALANNKVEVSIGRMGGTGGAGDNVKVISVGTLDTHGDRSSGILAQSIGGGGGTSGTIAVGGQYKSSDNSQNVTGKVVVGLEGGAGATSGKVEVIASGFITTVGDDASAILAQSIAGGGGVGGMASNSIMRANASLNIGVGGKGGAGADVLERVTVTNSATLTTSGETSDGILAQSIGGGGGKGGNAAVLGLPFGGPQGETPHTNLAVSVGGNGGTGGDANAILVDNFGAILTEGDHAAGIRAQSIGGGGGYGGTVLSARADSAKNSSMTLAVNVGGDGNSGGISQLVTVNNKGSIWTKGEQGFGISAVSIGGGGGEGGGVADFRLAPLKNDTFINMNLNIGGKGGTGGTAGAVWVTNMPVTGIAGSGQIVTEADNASGIFAQSLGGGGGNGGAVFSVTAGMANDSSGVLGINIGGFGDDGGTGGSVDVFNGGLIDTTGANSHGILAQSIGGGGGNGAMVIAGSMLIKSVTNTPLVAIGGVGGDGGNAGAVTVNNTGTIVTRGKDANGIFAQSVGGGGGNSAMGFSLSGNPYTLVGSNALAALIGATTSGDGGTGETVKVTNSGNIVTLGQGSTGIRAESINGGGGHLSFDFQSIETLFSLSCIPIPETGGTCIPGTGGTAGDRPVGQPLYSTRIGSTDSSDMNAGKVTIINTGTISSGGDYSEATAITSIGGGGGKLDLKMVLTQTARTADPTAIVPITFAVNLGSINATDSKGGTIDGQQTGDTLTTGRSSAGLKLMSAGGGGGDSLTRLTAPDGTKLGAYEMMLGATNGSHLEGGMIDRQNDGAIFTTGDWSTGAQIQSIGGGGGEAMIDIDAVDQSDLVVRLKLGADQGTHLEGGAVLGGYSGVQTEGDHSVAFLAQSIGAGGGMVMSAGTQTLDVTLGGKNGASGDGGRISLSNTGQIQSTGTSSHGVLLQSIGGGGGAVLTDATTRNVTLNSSNSGNGGDILFSQTGNIVTTGAGAYGLIAQSLGGGGGWVDGQFAGTAGGVGSGGDIDLLVNGSVMASGAGATAIFAQSLGSTGSGDMAVTVTGLVRGNAAGVRFDGGTLNTLDVAGSVSAVSGQAIIGGEGNDRVFNSGLMVGNIDLGSGSNLFENRQGATFVAFSTIDLTDPADSARRKSLSPNAAPFPPGGTFINDGDFLMGLSANPIPIDLANGAAFENLDSNGPPETNLLYGARVINTVALDGDFVQTAQGHMAFDVAFGPYASDRVNVSGNTTVAGTGDVVLTWLENATPVTLFATTGTAIDQGLVIKDTLALDYRIIADTGGIKLAFTPDFVQPFLNRNEGEVARHLNSAVTLGGSGGAGRLMARLGNIQAGAETSYAAIFSEINPEPFLAPQVLQLNNARQFAGDLNRCDQFASGRERCVWGRLAGSRDQKSADGETFGYTGSVMGFETGFQKRIDDKWSVNMAVGYDNISSLSVGNGHAEMKGDSFHGGVGAIRTFAGGTKIDLSLTTGVQTLNSQRLIQVFEPVIATSTPRTSYAMARTRLSHEFGGEGLFVRPAVSVMVTALSQSAFKEQGADGAAGVAHVQSFATFTPDLTVGYKRPEPDGGYSTFSFNVAATAHSTDRLIMPFRLAGANQTADPAMISTTFDPVSLRYGGDVNIVRKDGMASLNLSVAVENGERYSRQTFSLSARMKF